MVLFGIFLILVVSILNVKSDSSQLPSGRRSLDPLTEYMRGDEFRDETVVLLGTADEQATREISLIRSYRDSIQQRSQHLQRMRNQFIRSQLRTAQDQLARNQVEQNRLEDVQSRISLFIDEERTRGLFTETDRSRYRRTLLRYLKELYDLQEHIIMRYEVEVLARSLNLFNQYVQQQRARERPTQDRGLLEQHAREQQIYNQFQQELQGRVQRLLERLALDQPMNDQNPQEVDALIKRWLALQKFVAAVEERRAREAQQTQKRRVQENFNHDGEGSGDKRRKTG